MSLRASLVYAANAGAPTPKAAATARAAHTTLVHRMTRKHWIAPSFSAAIRFRHRASQVAADSAIASTESAVVTRATAPPAARNTRSWSLHRHPAGRLHHQVIAVPEAELLSRGKGEQDPVDPGDDQFHPVGQADAERLAGVRAIHPLFAVLRDVERRHGGRRERSPEPVPAHLKRLEEGRL